MTMTFTAPAGLAEGIEAGSQVDFSFHQDGGTYVLSSLDKR
jgi:Cu/Ag efflux protein CusF